MNVQQQRKFCDSARKVKSKESSKYQSFEIIAFTVQLFFTSSLSKASVAHTDEREFDRQSLTGESYVHSRPTFQPLNNYECFLLII